MKIGLVGPATLTEPPEPSPEFRDELDGLAENAPTGILILAAVLESRVAAPTVVDLNRYYYDHLLSGERTDLCAYSVERLAALDCDLYGFGTISSSYPLTIRIARELRRRRPDARIVLGGPQASVVDVATLEAFPFIDLIVRGEAEDTFPRVLDALAGSGQFDDIAGITWRGGARVIRNPNAPVILDLDSVPAPAYHLFPGMKKCRRISLELGRGCPFACKFCSTNDFFRRNFRLKSPGRVLQDMRRIHAEYGVDSFDLIHDMFTVDRRKVAAFCHAMLESGTGFKWNCSARTDCVDDDLIALMASAGCQGIFFGIETGSARLQKIIDKHLDLNAARDRIAAVDRNGVLNTVSLIVGFPEEERSDLEATVDFFLDSCRHDLVEPQIHILSALAETPLHSNYRDQLTFDSGWPDVYGERWVRDSESRALIEAHPELFPNFHLLPLRNDRAELVELRSFLLLGATRLRWMMVALHLESASFLDLFDQWRGWGERSTDYYQTPEFPSDFLRFVREFYLVHVNPQSVAVAALLEYELALRDAIDRGREHAPGGSAYPAVPDDVCLVEVDVDVIAIIDSLRRKELPAELSRLRTTLAVRSGAGRRADLLRLPELAAQLLKLCDGKTDLGEIVDRMEIPERFRSVPRDEIARVGLETLAGQNLIHITR